jgi:hypothetical protein
VGVLVASAVDSSLLIIQGVDYISPGLAFIIGYAGGDFLDSVYKIIISKIKIKK